MEFLSLRRRRSSSRNILNGEQRGETAVFAGGKLDISQVFWERAKASHLNQNSFVNKVWPKTTFSLAGRTQEFQDSLHLAC